MAAFLLGLRDLLRSAGWDGGSLDGSPRLADIGAAERVDAPRLSPFPPGLADLLSLLLSEIDRTPLPEPLQIRIAAPAESLDPIVGRVLAALALKGAAVETLPATGPTAPESTDLGLLQCALLSTQAGKPGPALSNDGTVLLLEADTPLEAGEFLAAYARSRPLDAATLVAGRDLGALESALARHGLPAIGAGERSRWRPALQVLPLRLALAFTPRDPFRAAELLMLPVTPIPWDARRRLLDALVEQPGVDSPGTGEAARGCAAVKTRSHRSCYR